MKIKIILLTIFMFRVNFSYAQQIIPLNEKEYLDSLNSVVISKDPILEKVKASYKLADFWRSRDTLKSREYLDQGKKWGQGDSIGESLYHFYEGQHYFTSDPIKAAEAFKKSAEEFSQYKSNFALTMQADSWFNYGIKLKDSKGYDFFMDIAINKAIPLINKTGNIEKKAHYFSQIGAAFTYSAQFDKGEEYQKKAYELLKDKKYQESPILLFTCLYRAMNFLYMPNSAAAKPYLEQAEQMLANYPNSINNGFLYWVQTLFFITTQQYDKALEQADRGIVFTKANKSHMLTQLLSFNKFNVYLMQKDNIKAKNVLLEIVKEKELMANALNKQQVYKYLASLSAELNQMDDAYTWLTTYSALNDSLNQSQFKEKLYDLEVKYESAEKEKKIAKLEAEKEFADLAIRNNRLFNWLLGLGSLFLFGFATFSWFYYQKDKNIAALKEMNYQQQIKEMSQEQQLNSVRAMLTGEEKERKRIAQDLHDGLGGVLAGIKMTLSKISEKQSKTDNTLSQIVDKIDYSLVELRRIAQNMMPASLLRFGLDIAIKDLCQLYKNPDVQIEYLSFQIRKDISQQNQLIIYRIVQELISNSIKHSGASWILLQCSQNQNTFFITIEDNGKGFDNEKSYKGKGMGLENIKSRVSYLNGHIDINSNPKEGTIINIELDVDR